MTVEIPQNTAYETVRAGRELLTLCAPLIAGKPLDDFARAAIDLNVMLDELAEAADVDSLPLPAGWYRPRGMPKQEGTHTP